MKELITHAILTETIAGAQMKYKRTIATLMVAVSGPVLADCVPHICSGIYVERLYANSNGLIYVATTGNESNLNCTPVSGGYLSFNLSDPAGDAFYSTLLAAQLANKTVSLRIVDASPGCQVQYLTLDKQ